MPIFLTVAFIILRAVLILKRRIGLSSGGEKYGSPKEAGKSGGLDVEAAGCTSQQKVDTTLYFYTSFNEHNTPYTVLESNNSESMPDVLH